MEFVTLTPEEFDTFSRAHPLGNFAQSVPRGLRRQKTGWTMHLVGVRDEKGVIIAAAELDQRRIFSRYSDFDCVQGPLVDYDDAATRDFFLKELQRYVKAHDGVRLTIDPPLLLNHRDGDAAIIDDGYSGESYIRALETCGYRKLPYREVDTNPGLFRWFFTKDLRGITSADQMLAEFDPKTRRWIKMTEKSGIKVMPVGADDIATFYQLMQHVGARRGFDVRDESYYQDLYELFDRDTLWFMLAKLNLNTYEANLRAVLAEETAKLTAAEVKHAAKPNDKHANQVTAQQKIIAAYDAKLAELPELRKDGDTLVLAGSAFIHYGSEMVYFVSGSYDQYSSFNAQYALQWWALKYALEHGIPRYNFYGTRGNYSGKPEQHGVYTFKRGFGGNVEEQIGYFVYIANPAIDTLRTVKNLSRRLRK